MNRNRFVDYYVSQTGYGTLPGFSGRPAMYGRGLGSVLSRAFRFIIPFFKRGAQLAKPHLASAAKGIASDLVGTVTSEISQRLKRSGQGPEQEGSGLLNLTRLKKNNKRHASTVTALKQSRKEKRRKLSTRGRQKTVRNQGLIQSDIF